MNKVAIYPGTFDPITFGHIDVIKKGLKLFDKIVVAVSNVENKDYLFDSDERIEIVKKALFYDLKLNKKKVVVISFSSLTTELCNVCLLYTSPSPRDMWTSRMPSSA